MNTSRFAGSAYVLVTYWTGEPEAFIRLLAAPDQFFSGLLFPFNFTLLSKPFTKVISVLVHGKHTSHWNVAKTECTNICFTKNCTKHRYFKIH